MPTELALLPFVESAFNPEAMSSARASGMWQFMPGTGRIFELKQNVFRDDRRDVLASTRAALDYLTRLYGMFGDWHLALAAYNWGEGNVRRAIMNNRRAGKPTNYSSLKMPAETRDYVPKLQAVKNIVANPAAYALTLPRLENHPYFLAVPVQRDIDVSLAARLAQLDLDEFRALNPQLNKPVILAAGTPQVLLPYDNANAFVKAMPQHVGPYATRTAWTAPRTMKPAEAAKLTGMDEAELRAVNAIPARVLVKAGSTLLVPRTQQRTGDVPEGLADNGVLVLSPESPTLRRVAFAKRYRVSVQQVAQWNQVAPSAHFAAGSTVVVYLATSKRAKSARKTHGTTVADSRTTAQAR
jgi:membrane-bound lytic murein transglycosylase D